MAQHCTMASSPPRPDASPRAPVREPEAAAFRQVPVLDGALTWVECAVEAVHEAGDHYLVVGRVTRLGACRAGRPLLFYRGRYAATDPGHGPAEVVDTLLAWPRHADWM